MRKIISLFVFFQFIFLPCFGQVVINEIMYDPNQCSDSYCEWIEIFNPTNKSVNLSDWKLCEDELLAGYVNNTGEDNPPILRNTTMILSSGQYAIITDGGKTNTSGTKVYQYFNVSNDSLALHVDVSTLCGGGLKNTGETINLSNGTYTEIVNYNNSAGWPEAKDGYSLQRINSSQNLSNNLTNWIAFPPSPGKPNFYENATLELLDILTDGEIYVNETTNISVKIANRGMKNATNISVNLYVNNTHNDSKTINVTGINIREIQFNWIFNETGNYTIFAHLKNETIFKNISVLPPLQKNATLAMYIEDTILLDIEYTSLFKIEIENKSKIEGNCSRKDNITVQYNITNLTGELIKENNFTVEVGCSKWANTGSWKPNQTGNFTVCGRIINATTSFNNTTVCNNITVIQNPIEILSKPESTSFGSLNFVLFKFELNKLSAEYFELNNTDLKFVVYTPRSQGHYVIRDFDEDIIYSIGGCNSDFSLEVKNVSENFSAYIFLPFYITANCNDYYDEGSYLSKIRMFKLENGNCSSSSSNRYDISKFKVDVNGKNQVLCPTCPKCTSSKKTKSKEKSKTLEIEILNLTKTLARNQEFTTRVKLKNNFGKKVLFEIYSYIFDGSNCLTGNWRVNLKKIKLNKDEERIINLTNKVEKEAKPWYYSFRIRIKLKDGSNIDKTEQIKITNKILKNKKEMKETPNLKIWNDTKIRMNLSNCEGCKMIIVGPNISVITGRKYRVFEDFGRYEVFVIKDEIVLNQTYFWKEKTVSNKTEKNLTEEGKSEEENKTIGKFSENKSKSLVDKVVSTLQNLVSPLIEAMKLSVTSSP